MYYLIDEQEKLDRIEVGMSPVSLDIECTGLDIFKDKIITVQLKIGDDIYIVDVRKVDIAQFLNSIKNIPVILHNAKFDLKFIKFNYGIEFNSIHDTMLCEALILNGIGNKFNSLSSLVNKYRGIILDKEVRETFVNNYDIELTEEILRYCALDVLYLEDIKSRQLEIINNQGQSKVLDLEMDLINALIEMEIEGFPISKELWIEIARENEIKLEEIKKSLVEFFAQRLLTLKEINKLTAYDLAVYLYIPVKTKKLEKELREIPAESSLTYISNNINFASAKQVKRILEVLSGVTLEDTNEKTLIQHKNIPEIAKLLEFREFAKKVSTYGENYLSHVNPDTGRIHCEILQVASDSGRMSASKPNLLQVPREGRYRESFVAPTGWKFLDVDFSQEELRLFGAVTKEPKFIEAYKHGIDMHKLTASLIYNVPIEAVTKEQRQIAKSLNFACIYGTTEYGLAYNFQMDIEEARELLYNFWKGYSTAKAFSDRFNQLIWENCFSITVLKRKRFFEKKTLFADIKEASRYKSKVFRELGNHLVQGTGADILKLSLARIKRENPFGDNLKIVLPVHDEIICLAKDEIAEEALEFIKRIMKEEEQKFLGDIPAEVDGKISTHWEH